MIAKLAPHPMAILTTPPPSTTLLSTRTIQSATATQSKGASTVLESTFPIKSVASDKITQGFSLPPPATAAATSISGTNINLPSPGVLIDGKTLIPGGTMTSSGTTYILPIGGTVPLVETRTPSLGMAISTLAQSSGLILDEPTLVSGNTVVVSGTAFILPSGGTSPVALGTPSNTSATLVGRPTKGGDASGSKAMEGNKRLFDSATIFSIILSVFFSF